MTVLERWQQLLGIRPAEGRSVSLFFLHNFLLGIGTILVYVSANVILLENNPERNLPLAYGVAALAMIVAGKVYGHYEHHMALQSLAVRVLLAVVVFTGVLGVLVAVGHSVVAAVAIMAGYRVIYLLTNLEFWGISAVVFDVRQGRRLFSIISSGDMPAKAMGAVLAVLIHHHSDLLWLLVTALVAYVGALLTLRATGRQHVVEARGAPRRERAEAVAPRLQRWFGNSHLVLSLCVSLMSVAVVTTGVEYSFFVNVKHKFHDQAVVMQYVGSVLVITYLVALVFKLLFSRITLDQLGIRWMLLALPLVLLVSLLLFGGLWVGHATASTLLFYFCGLYLILEVLRRAVFDPVFLVLFQPLSAPERLHAHTLAKGLYEPLGMALGGILLFVLYHLPALEQWVLFACMSLFMAGALYFLHRTYGYYLAELQHSLSRRFTANDTADAGKMTWSAAGSGAAAKLTAAEPTAQLIAYLSNKERRLAAADALVQQGQAAVGQLAAVLRTSTDESLIRRVAQVCGRIQTPVSRQALIELAQQPHRAGREIALRVLRGGAPRIEEAPLFQALVQDEMQLAHQLLQGLAAGNDEPLQRALHYELTKVQERIFGLLFQLYSPTLIADAQRGILHAARERQANALEILDNLISRSLYQGLQALLEVGPYAEKVRVFDRLLGTAQALPPILTRIIQEGQTTFTDWTTSRVLAQWQPAPSSLILSRLLPHLHSTSALIRDSAFQALAWVAKNRPAPYQQFIINHQLSPLLMDHEASAASISALDRVSVLQHTTLFAATPENVLSSIVPIMKEVTFQERQRIFAKGDLGASLFLIYEGEVGIFNGPRQLATFRKGDFFGELALLDAEPRSASAVAGSHVVAFRLDQEDFYDVMEERSEVLRNILQVLCQRLRLQNEKMQVTQ